METKKKPKIVCAKCARHFETERGLHQHAQKAHPYIPPPAPKRETLFARSCLPETRTLLGAKKTLDVGDVYYSVTKYVIKSITFTEGSDDVKVTVEQTKSHWQKEKPQ